MKSEERKSKVLEKSKSIVKKNKSQKDIMNESMKSYYQKRTLSEERIKNYKVELKHKAQKKWEEWNQNYHKVISANTLRENELQDYAMKSLNRLQDAFNKVQSKYEERLTKTSQDNFHKTEKSNWLTRNIRHCDG